VLTVAILVFYAIKDGGKVKIVGCILTTAFFYVLTLALGVFAKQLRQAQAEALCSFSI
jgi:hypothetical protein